MPGRYPLPPALAVPTAVGTLAFGGGVAMFCAALGWSAPVAVAAGLASGIGFAVALLESRARRQRAALTRIRGQWQDVGRSLLAATIPQAVSQSTSADGSLDVDRFRDIVLVNLGKAFQVADPAGPGTSVPATWELDQAADARTPDQDARLKTLLAYPSAEETPELLSALDGLGPQTLFQFIEFAQQARERLSVGLEPVRQGLPRAILTGHLVSAGLVEKVEAPPAGPLTPPEHAYYSLTPRGYRVARLFSPRTARPQELAALDPAPGV